MSYFYFLKEKNTEVTDVANATKSTKGSSVLKAGIANLAYSQAEQDLISINVYHPNILFSMQDIIHRYEWTILSHVFGWYSMIGSVILKTNSRYITGLH